MISEILGLFVNTLTAEKYSLFNRENLLQPIQITLFKKQEVFLNSFAAFLKSPSRFEHFERKISLIAFVYPK